MSVELLYVLIGSIALVLAYYGIFTKWYRHRAGQSQFALFAALLALSGYIMFAKNVGQPERGIVANVLCVILIGAVWYMGAVMIRERIRRD
jgi:hypothetical protein